MGGTNGSVSGLFLADPILDKAFEILRGQVSIPIQYSRVAARLEMATGKSKVYKPLGSEDAIDCRKRRSTRLRHCRTLAGVISNNFATSSVES
jgi:hypothetical protein